MFTNVLKNEILPALASVALLAATAVPAAAFTLNAPTLGESAAKSNIEPAYYYYHRGYGYRGYGYRGYGYRGYGYRPYGYGYGYGVRCWINPYGVRVCRW